MVQVLCPGLCPLLPSSGFSAVWVKVSQRAFLKVMACGSRLVGKRISARCEELPKSLPCIESTRAAAHVARAESVRCEQAGGAGPFRVILTASGFCVSYVILDRSHRNQ